MNKKEFQVCDMIYELDGHDEDTEIKIKLLNGDVLPIAGLQYRHPCVGGDDIIYIKEGDPIREKYEKDVKLFVDFANNVLQNCEAYYYKMNRFLDDDYDCCHMLNVENEIAKACDEWFKWLELDIKYENGAGSSDEVFFKVSVLEKWLSKQDIPKEVPVF